MKLLPGLSSRELMRKIGLGPLVDDSPYRLGHPFNQTVPRRIYRMHKGWITYPDYIKEADAAITAYSGGDFIDVGAAKGVYPLFLAPKAKNARFLLLEPDPAFVKPMLATVQAAMENYPSFIPYVIPVGAGAENIRRMEFNTNGRIFHADIVKIDDLVESFGLEPCFVKIDVDGPEFFVLQGMKETTKRFRPSILLEMHYSCWKNGETEDSIFAQLPGYRFDLVWESFWQNDPKERCARFLCAPK